MFSFRKKLEMPAPEDALPGRATPIPTAQTHFVNGRPLKGAYPAGLAMSTEIRSRGQPARIVKNSNELASNGA